MRTLTSILVIALAFTINTHAQTVYHVTRVQGTVTNLNTKLAVDAGDTLDSEDVLLFESYDSYLIAIGSSMERYQIKYPERAVSEGLTTLTGTVKETASPTRMRNLMLARFNPTQSQISDLRQYFGNDKFSIIGDAVSVPLDQQKYPLTDDKFIVFYYRVDNNPVSKKIGHDDQSLILERNKLVSSSAGAIEGNEISDLTVYEYQVSSRSSREITKFTLVFVDKNELVNEFNTIIPILKRQKMDDLNIKKYLIEYYYDFYGATDSKTIDTFAEQIVKNY